LIERRSNKKDREIFFPWFASILYDNGEGKINIEIGQRFKKVLLKMKSATYL